MTAMPAPDSLESYDFERCALISASAGTGKTHTITRLVVKLLLGCGHREPLPLENILVVTFTNAATSDLVDRIRGCIRSVRLGFSSLCTAARAGESLDDLQKLLAGLSLHDDLKKILSDKLCLSGGSAKALALYYRVLLHAERSIDRAPICTIHSFCNRALNQIYAFEAGQAFNTELSEDLTEIGLEARHSLYRELFYPEAEGILPLLGRLYDEYVFTEPSENSKVIRVDEIARRLLEVRSSKGTDSYYGFRVAGFKRQAPGAAAFRQLKQEVRDSLTGYVKAEQNFKQKWLKNFQDFMARHQLKLELLIGPDNTSGPAYGEKPLNFYVDAVRLFDSLRSLLQGQTDFDLKQTARLAQGLKTCYAKQTLHKGSPGKQADLELIEAFEREFFSYVADLRSYAEKESGFVDSLKLKLGILYLEKFDRLCRMQGVMSNTELLYKLNTVLQHQVDSGSQALCSLLRHRYPVAMIDEFQDTDPLQLAIFEKIYLCREAKQAQAVCCFIGDPKQSIYGFRGADIHSYLYAKERILSSELDGRVYDLPNNYRSAKTLVAATNMVFNHENKEPFGSGIVFKGVGAANIQELSFYFADTESPDPDKPLFYICGLGGEQLGSKGELTQLQAERCARTVLHCLKEGVLTKQGRERRVRPSDLCILVRTGREAQLIREVLYASKVRSVFFSDRDSVLKSESATQMVYLLAAMYLPNDARRVRRLLSSALLSCTPAEFIARTQEDKLAREMDLLTECRRLWQINGFLGAFEHWLCAPIHKGLEQLLSQVEGERHLTDLYQLAEIIQTQHLKQRSLFSQLKWFLEYKQECRNEHLKRLESEVAQVKIYTEHSSKGLEFNVVLLPFICSAKMKSYEKFLQIYRSGKNSEQGQRVLVIEPDKQEYEDYFKEQELEDMRLLYVALTRAKTALFIYPADFKTKGNMARSAMSNLWNDLRPCLEGQGRSYFTQEVLPDEPLCLQNPARVTEQLGYAEFARELVNHRCRTSSFTALTSGLHELKAPKYEGDEQQEQVKTEELRPETLPGQELSPFTFPRGTRPGSFLHLLLERLKFELVSTQELSALSSSLQLCDYAVYSRLLKSWCKDEVKAQEGLKTWLVQMCRAPLYQLDDLVISLSSLKEGEYLTELGFTFPAQNFSADRFNQEICIPQAVSVLGESLAQSLYLSPATLEGYLTGQIDLFCALPGREGRQYYVIDYKSTHLGDHYADYGVQALQNSVFSPQNRYDVQFLIYTLSAHRYLKERLKDYDYERDFGGVMYLYVRGLREDSSPGQGVFHFKPRLADLEKLDAMFQGRGV